MSLLEACSTCLIPFGMTALKLCSPMDPTLSCIDALNTRCPFEKLGLGKISFPCPGLGDPYCRQLGGHRHCKHSCRGHMQTLQGVFFMCFGWANFAWVRNLYNLCPLFAYFGATRFFTNIIAESFQIFFPLMHDSATRAGPIQAAEFAWRSFRSRNGRNEGEIWIEFI